MRLSKYQQAKERARLRNEVEREKDMIYHVLFQRKDWKHGDPVEERYFPKVPAFRNPDKDSEALQSAIDRFQREHGVSDWREIASFHITEGYWYG